MNTSLSQIVKVIVFALVVLAGLVPAAGAEEVTLSATFQEPTGQTGAIEVTVMLAEPAAPSAPPVFDTPQAQAVPEPSTLVFVGVGVLGLVVLRKKGFWCFSRKNS